VRAKAGISTNPLSPEQVARCAADHARSLANCFSTNPLSGLYRVFAIIAWR
jgi:hypothetical protein|tara:strand:- start:507 stop:659 length:153 start_codon:yes stop_codon:yes gene_type:complete